MSAPARFAGSDRFREQSAATMTERHLQSQVIALATALDYRSYHTHDSRRSQPGWPDLALWRGPVLILAELKTQRGPIRPAQRVVLDALAQTPAVVVVWRPMDLLDGTIERVLRGDR